jgi:hypothetical protein
VTTLTSVSYGDIAPLAPVARCMAALEGVIGQLFPVLLLARLVSMELSERRLGSAALDRHGSEDYWMVSRRDSPPAHGQNSSHFSAR